MFFHIPKKRLLTCVLLGSFLLASVPVLTQAAPNLTEVHAAEEAARETQRQMQDMLWRRTHEHADDATKIISTDLTQDELYYDNDGYHLDKQTQDAYIKEEMGVNATFKSYHFAPPTGWKQEILTAGAAPLEHLSNPAAQTTRAILELHGGAYTLPLSDKHRMLAAKLGLLIDAKDVYLSDYRLAPTHTYPAALDDAVSAYEAMLASGIKPQDIILYGDSAGGNLALEFALYLKVHGTPEPAAMIPASPWADFGTTLPSRTKNAKKDYSLGIGTPLYDEVMHPSYGGSLDAASPLLTPLHADLSGLPPMLIQVGGDELFLDDGKQLAEKVKAAGGKVGLTIYPGLCHDFAVVVPKLAQSQQSLLEMRNFINKIMEAESK